MTETLPSDRSDQDSDLPQKDPSHDYKADWVWCVCPDCPGTDPFPPGTRVCPVCHRDQTTCEEV